MLFTKFQLNVMLFASYPARFTAFLISSSVTPALLLSSNSTLPFFIIRLTEALLTPGIFLRLLSMFEAHEAQCIPCITIIAFFIFCFLLFSLLLFYYVVFRLLIQKNNKNLGIDFMDRLLVKLVIKYSNKPSKDVSNYEYFNYAKYYPANAD